MRASEWGFMTLPGCDQGRTAHLLKADGSPACGCAFYASCGCAMPDVHVNQKCRHCLSIEGKRARNAKGSS